MKSSKMKRSTIWAVVALIGSYVAAQAIADVAATKLVVLWKIVLPAGSIMFALTFTLRDLVHKRLGKQWAQVAILFSAMVNVVQAVYLWWMAQLPAPPYYEYADAWKAIFAIVPSITIASIIAEVVSELTDTEVYHWWYRTMIDKYHWPQWTAVLASNIVSLPIDSFLFGTLAFAVLPYVLGGTPVTVWQALGLVAGQIVWKAIVTVISMPTIYLVKRKPLDVAV